jgi:hypothetical protein
VLEQQLDDLGCRRLAHVVDVGLVGEPDHEHGSTAQRLAELVEAVDRAADHVVRHRAVDLARELDEARVVAELRAFQVR